MGAVSGTGTTYTLPNFHGELFTVTPVDTPFLSLIGGINGAKVTHAKEFEWQTIDRRAGAVNNVVLEGQPAPTASNRSRANVKNVTEIHQSKISVSYTKLGAVGQFGGVNVAPEWDDFMEDELTLQTHAELQSMAVDIEQSFLSGVYQLPTDNTTTRKTKGILNAVTTNLDANGGVNRAFTTALLDALLSQMYTNGAPLDQEHTVIMAGAAQSLALNNAYATSSALSAPTRDRNIGGMAIKTITTIFGTFGAVLNRYMPAHQIAVVDLSVCYPVFMEIPQKGLLFVEELARTGASRDFQLYGEVGLEFGPETYHGILADLT